MADTKYTFTIETDFPNNKVDVYKLTQEINNSSITVALSYVYANEVLCDVYFKNPLSVYDTTSTLVAIISSHDGETIKEDEAPKMDDGRPIIRADSRPMGFQTYYTMAGDDSTAGIGNGIEFIWDFSNDGGIVTGDHVPSGMKCKEFMIQFLCPIYTKDGALYFFDAPWGCYVEMDIVIPPGEYYPNPAGQIPAAMLGLSGNDMYANTGTDYVTWASYLKKYRICGDCPMGDEINAEGSSMSPIPPSWRIRGRVYTPTTDNVSKGFAELELHRCHTVLLPGQTVQDIIDSH